MSTNGNGKHPGKPNGTALSGSFGELTFKEENKPTAEEDTIAYEEVFENLDVTSAQLFWEGTGKEIDALLDALKTAAERKRCPQQRHF
jgi:hypothetical protein